MAVEIHLPNAVPTDDSFEIEQLKDSVHAFLSLHGAKPDPNCEKVELYASWHWGEWFRRLRGAADSSAIVQDIREALRRQQIDESGARAFKDRATAASGLIKGIESFDNGVIRLGDVFIAKATINGTSRIAVHTLAPELARLLDQAPHIASDAVAFFQFVDSHKLENGMENKGHITQHDESTASSLRVP